MIHWDCCGVFLLWKYLQVSCWQLLKHCRCRDLLSFHYHVLTMEELDKLLMCLPSCIYWDHSKELCLRNEGFDIAKYPLPYHAVTNKGDHMQVHVWCFCAIHKSLVDHGSIKFFFKAIINQLWRYGNYLHYFFLIYTIACPFQILINHMLDGKKLFEHLLELGSLPVPCPILLHLRPIYGKGR